MIVSGSVFIADLKRRALADRRMALFETTLVAGMTAAVALAQISPWGVEWPSVRTLVLAAVLCGVGWAVLAALLISLASRVLQDYSTALLVDTGLLYLVLEHEPAETLGPLKTAEKIMRLSPASAPSVLSFRQRILAFVRRFPACCAATGFQPQPAGWRMLRLVLLAASACLAAGFSWTAYMAFSAARVELPVDAGPLKAFAIALVWSVMLSAVLLSVQRSAPVLALAGVLLGEDSEGTAVRAGRNL